MKHHRAAFAVVVATLMVGLVASSASAKFTLHNGNDVTQTDVVDGSDLNVCGDRISGLAGWASTLGPAEIGALPPSVSSPLQYEVFQFPAGANPALYEFNFDVNTGEGSYTLFDGDGNVVDTAVRLKGFTTAPRVVIPGGPIVQTPDDPEGTTLYIYSQVPFDEALAPTAPDGALIVIKPAGFHARRDLTVVDCEGSPTDVVASIDAQPGSTKNKVKLTGPASTRPSLVILVKGSATLDVTTIASANVGNAAPVTKGKFAALSVPVDVNGDGFKDRRYYFRPNQTDLTCTSSSVTIDGALQSGALWSGTDRIKPVCCGS